MTWPAYLWQQMWPNAFTPSFFTVAGFVLSHLIGDRRHRRRHAEIVAHITKGSAMTQRAPMPGTNIDHYADVAGSHAGQQGYRVYFTPGEGIPKAWPARPADARLTCVSIRPPVDEVIAGTLDAELAAFARLVPVGQMVTLWHEGDGARFGYTPEQVKAMHARAYHVMKAANPHFRYGQIMETYTASTFAANYPLTPWVTPGLDFYALDGYPVHVTDTPEGVFGPAVEQIRAAGIDRHIFITETNSAFDRPSWFAAAWAYAKSIEARTFWSYFGVTERTHPWRADDTATIAVLQEIEAEYLASEGI